jgi:hypothetical protein
MNEEDVPRDYFGRFRVRNEEPHLTDGLVELDPDVLRQKAQAVIKAARLAGNPTPMVGLRAVRAVRSTTETLELYAVANARGLGWSWAEIAEVLGLSKQVVHRRYGVVNPRRRQRRRGDRWAGPG